MATFTVNVVKLFNFKPFYAISQCLSLPSPEFISVRNYAARRGTRERKAKVLKVLKKKAEERRAREARAREKVLIPKVSRRFNDSFKPICEDNIVMTFRYRLETISFEEAVKCHRETHHPTVYNVPDAPLRAFIELDMKAPKKNRFIDGFQRIVKIPHPFEHGESRSILVFCKDLELQTNALESGARKAGGAELIKEIEKGDISLKDYDIILGHVDILPQLVPIRGLLKRRFPNLRDGTMGQDIPNMILKFLRGIKYRAESDQYEKDYGLVDVSIGTLDMETEHLKGNLQALLRDLYSMKPKRPGPFITTLFLISDPSVEKLKLDPVELVPEMKELEESTESGDASDSDEEEAVAEKTAS